MDVFPQLVQKQRIHYRQINKEKNSFKTLRDDLHGAYSGRRFIKLKPKEKGLKLLPLWSKSVCVPFLVVVVVGPQTHHSKFIYLECSQLICKGKSSCVQAHCHEISTSTWLKPSIQASATFYCKDLQARRFIVIHSYTTQLLKCILSL